MQRQDGSQEDDGELTLGRFQVVLQRNRNCNYKGSGKQIGYTFSNSPGMSRFRDRLFRVLEREQRHTCGTSRARF